MNGRIKKSAPSDVWREELRKSVKGKPEKQAVDDFAVAIHTLVAALGKSQALSLYTKAGVLITLAKDEIKQP